MMMPGRWILTATARPSSSAARWTWPSEAAAAGVSSKRENAFEIRVPSSSSSSQQVS
jgi:hypothetical protein